MITRFLITWSRFAFSSWVGAAILFVVVGIREITFEGFESPIRDQLVLLRFPAYYAFGFALVGSGLVSLLLATFLGESNKSCSALKSCGCMRLPIIVALLTLIIMVVDYMWIYLPLESLITPPGSPRTPQFISLHKASMYINMVHVGLAMVVAWRLNWPVAPRTASVDVDASPKVEA
ncbi:MAG: hypothetical protein R3C18_01195 [Planctomycetaceae bacterium]